MTEKRYLSLIEFFKEQDSPEKIIFIADDVELTKIVLSFKNVECRFVENENKSEDWKSLWECTEIDKKGLTEITNVNPDILERYLNVLIGNKIIYPDGMISENVLKFINMSVMKKIKKK